MNSLREFIGSSSGLALMRQGLGLGWVVRALALLVVLLGIEEAEADTKCPYTWTACSPSADCALAEPTGNISLLHLWFGHGLPLLHSRLLVFLRALLGVRAADRAHRDDPKKLSAATTAGVRSLTRPSRIGTAPRIMTHVATFI